MDWLAGILELLAVWLVGNKRKIAFLVGFAGNVAWFIYVLWEGHTYGLLLVCVPVAGINLRNYVKWAREERNV